MDKSSRHTMQKWKKLGVIWPCADDATWDACRSAPHVMWVEDKLRMVYHGRGADGLIRIGLAEADPQDPMAWTKLQDGPVLDLGPVDSLDSHWAGYPWVVPITKNHWHMYYATWDGTMQREEGAGKVWRTSMAESDDGGLTWARSGRALVPIGRPGACDEHATGSCAVRKVGDEYWMWYTAISRHAPNWYRISVALAVSRDGGHTFEAHPAGSLLSLPPRIGCPGATCSKPFVEVAGDQFRMWFSCATDGQYYRIHYAESDDGIHFRWCPGPVLDVSTSGWDSDMTAYPSIVHVGDRTLMYYVGNSCAGIGVAELVDETQRF